MVQSSVGWRLGNYQENLTLTGRDTIFDFTSADRINLSSIDANTKVSGNQAFTFIGTRDFTGKAGELTYDKMADFAIHLDDVLTLQKGVGRGASESLKSRAAFWAARDFPSPPITETAPRSAARPRL